jgi:hypothetical protein
MALTALLLVGSAAAVATAPSADPAAGTEQGRPEARPTGARPTERDRPGNVSARLTFGGVVLERHAVGVTAAYPRVRLTSDGEHRAAEVELVTFNCLRDEAPADPVAAGCARTVPEHAELSAPELRVEVRGDGLRLRGRFPTFRRPNGSAPVPTGRVYELALSAAPRDGRGGEGREPATGLLDLGEDRVSTVDEGPNELTYGR